MLGCLKCDPPLPARVVPCQAGGADCRHPGVYLGRIHLAGDAVVDGSPAATLGPIQQGNLLLAASVLSIGCIAFEGFAL